MTYASRILRAVSTADAVPSAMGPHRSVSGQLPANPAVGAFVQSIRNVEAIVRTAGGSLNDVVKTTVLLADLAWFAAVNQAYGARFAGEPKLARAAYQSAALPLGAPVEIEAIAVLTATGGR